MGTSAYFGGNLSSTFVKIDYNKDVRRTDSWANEKRKEEERKEEEKDLEKWNVRNGILISPGYTEPVG